MHIQIPSLWRDIVMILIRQLLELFDRYGMIKGRNFLFIRLKMLGLVFSLKDTDSLNL